MYDCLVIGAGFTGVAAAYRLKDAGFENFLVVDKAPGAGGCWYWSRYPGCACDVPSILYSLSFAPYPRGTPPPAPGAPPPPKDFAPNNGGSDGKPGWSRLFAPQGEIRAYLEDTIDRFGLRGAFRFGTEAFHMEWDEAAAAWRIKLRRAAPPSAEAVQGGKAAAAGGAGETTTILARAIISGVGGLHEPNWPEWSADFTGARVHAGRWDPAVQLAGKRVAVVGTGASAAQLVPELAKVAGRLTVYQRTAPWTAPRNDVAVPEWIRNAVAATPAAAKLWRLGQFLAREAMGLAFHCTWLPVHHLLQRRCENNLQRHVKDAAMRELLRPKYRAGCKRVFVTDEWYPALLRPNVTVVPHGVVGCRGSKVLDSSGGELEHDVLVLATGFDRFECNPFNKTVVGRLGMTIVDSWAAGSGAVAYKSTALHGFPNFFMGVGPFSGIGHSSLTIMIERQVEYAVKALQFLRQTGAGAIDVVPPAQDGYVSTLRGKLKRLVWGAGGCTSYYMDKWGNLALWPYSLLWYNWIMRRFDSENYVVTPLPAGAAPLAASGGRSAGKLSVTARVVAAPQGKKA